MELLLGKLQLIFQVLPCSDALSAGAGEQQLTHPFAVHGLT